MNVYDGFWEILKIQKFRRIVSYTGFYCFVAVLSYAYNNNTTRAGYSRGDQFYASYPAGTELLTDTTKLYKAALGNVFELEEWGPIEYCIMVKHLSVKGKIHMLTMQDTWLIFFLKDNSTEWLELVGCWYTAKRIVESF